MQDQGYDAIKAAAANQDWNTLKQYSPAAVAAATGFSLQDATTALNAHQNSNVGGLLKQEYSNQNYDTGRPTAEQFNQGMGGFAAPGNFSYDKYGAATTHPAGAAGSLGGSTLPYQMPGGSMTGSTLPYQMPGGQGGPSSGFSNVSGGSASGGAGGGSVGGGNGMGSQNPYLAQQIQALRQSSNQTLMQNALPGINGAAQSAGQYGGTRQGAAQGMAIGNAQTGLDAATAGLLSGNYQFDGNLALGNKNSDQQYGLGLGNLALGNQNSNNSYNLGLGSLNNQATGLNQQFYTGQRGQDLQQIQLGANLFGQGVSGNAALGQGQYNTGQQAYQAPQNALNSYGAGVGQFTGLNGSQSQTGPNSQAANAAGGAALGNLAGNSATGKAVGNYLGNLWNGGNSSTVNTGNASYTPDQGAYYYGQ